MRPDEIALISDLRSPTFIVGERRGKWRLEGLRFPYALFFIAARPLPTGPAGFLLRSECSGYPASGPTSQLWHGAKDAPLTVECRPQTPTGVMLAFQEWEPCIYHPIDRRARTHNNWEHDFPEKLWAPTKNITFLLETVHELFHSSEYLGAPLSAEALNLPASFMDNDLRRAS